MTNRTYQYYAGSRIYKNDKTLNYLLMKEGMINKSSGGYVYEYHLKDHLGNVRVTFQPNGTTTTVKQATEYYPFGMNYPQSPGGTNKYLYNGKEKQDDELSGTFLDWYDYGARMYDPTIGRWQTVDPMAEKLFSWGPYLYCFNNPIKFIDIKGMIPGQLFRNIDDAAIDFGLLYNDNSIVNNIEYGSSIYIVKEKGKIYYTYAEPEEGSEGDVDANNAPNGAEVVADIHTHAKYIIDSDDFYSRKDQLQNEDQHIIGYLCTPSGLLLAYYTTGPNAFHYRVVRDDLPNDPKDPNRAKKNRQNAFLFKKDEPTANQTRAKENLKRIINEFTSSSNSEKDFFDMLQRLKEW